MGFTESTWRNINIFGRNELKRSIRGVCDFYQTPGYSCACTTASRGLINCLFWFSYVVHLVMGDDKMKRKCGMMGITGPTWRYLSKLWIKLSRSKLILAEMASMWYWPNLLCVFTSLDPRMHVHGCLHKSFCLIQYCSGYYVKCMGFYWYIYN